VRRGRLTFVHWAIDTVAAVIVAPIFVVVTPTRSTVTVVPIGRQFARVLCVAKGTRASSFNGVGDTIVVTNNGMARGLRKKKETSESWSCDGVQQYSVCYQQQHPAAAATTTATTIVALNKQQHQHHHHHHQQQQQLLPKL